MPALEGAHWTAGAHQVREEPLDDPLFRLYHEPFLAVVALDDHQGQGDEAVLDDATGVAAISPDELQQVVRVGHLGKQALGGDASAGVCRGDRHRRQRSEGVDHDVPLAAIDELAAIEAAAVRADDGVGHGRLGVEHARARFGIAARPGVDVDTQPVVQFLDQALVVPAAEEGLHPVPRWEVRGHRPPLDAVSTR
nr:hypothetical protein [Streptomyces sp. ET3-23]